MWPHSWGFFEILYKYSCTHCMQLDIHENQTAILDMCVVRGFPPNHMFPFMKCYLQRPQKYIPDNLCLITPDFLHISQLTPGFYPKVDVEGISLTLFHVVNLIQSWGGRRCFPVGILAKVLEFQFHVWLLLYEDQLLCKPEKNARGK